MELEQDANGHEEASYWVPNASRSAYLPCPDVHHPLFADAEEFEAPPVSLPRGRFWQRLLRDPLAGGRPARVYYGMQQPVAEHVRHNACSTRRPLDEKGQPQATDATPYPFLYSSDDWPSSYEAFEAADSWFRGVLAARGNNDQRRSSGASGPVLGPNELSALQETITKAILDAKGPPAQEPDRQAASKSSQKSEPDLYLDSTKSDRLRSLSPDHLDQEVWTDEASPARRANLVSYSPFGKAAFEVPELNLKVARKVQGLWDDVIGWYRQGHEDILKRTFYCGRKHFDAVRYLHGQDAGERERHRQLFLDRLARESKRKDVSRIDLPLSLLGDPGQCFQYGKTYRLPDQRKSLYFAETEFATH